MRKAVTLSSGTPSGFWILGFKTTTVTVYNYTGSPVYLRIGRTELPTDTDYDFLIPPGANTTYPSNGVNSFAAIIGPTLPGSIFSTSITDRVDLNFSDENETPGANAGISLSAVSAFAIGNPPPTGPGAGTGLWLDSNGLVGLLASVVQFLLDATTGAIEAGAGNVSINVNGITLSKGSYYVPGSAIKWGDDNNKIVGYTSAGGSNVMRLQLAQPDTAKGSTLEMIVDGGSATGTGQIDLTSAGSGQIAFLSIKSNGSSFSGVITFQDGLRANAPIRLKGYTVATLPAGTAGDTVYCTDLAAPVYGAAPVGGGAIARPVFYTGAGWVVA